MPIINPLPTADEVRVESRLRPEQVSSTFTTADLNEDIEVRIREQANLVEQRLMVKALPNAWTFNDDALEVAFPKYTQEQRDALTVRQLDTAFTVIKLLSLSSLYMTAGQLNPAFLERSVVFQQRGEMVLKSLENEVQFITSSQTGNTSKSGFATLYTGGYKPNVSDPNGFDCSPI